MEDSSASLLESIGHGAMTALATVYCCVCGSLMRANAVNTCATCLASRHDVTEQLEKSVVILQCKRCRRYQRDDGGWAHCEDESKELLAFCLKKVQGLKKVRLVDAGFIWTEAHSRRVRIKVKVQAEVVKGIILQQSSQIEFIVRPMFCDSCHRDESSLSFRAVVQLRQHVNHKRTFLYLEQLILKHRAQGRVLKVEPLAEGVDFYFATKTDASRFVGFLESAVPVKSTMSEKLISADLKSNEALYNFSYSVELAPICKDDFVVLPREAARRHGNISRLVVCSHVASAIRFIDFQTCQVCEMTKETYWGHPFPPVLDASRLVEFVVLNVTVEREEEVEEFEEEGEEQDEEDEEREKVGAKRHMGNKRNKRQNEVGEDTNNNPTRKRRRRAPKSTTHSTFSSSSSSSATMRLSTKHSPCIVEIAREKDLGVCDTTFTVRSHLGRILRAGDSVLGYDLSSNVINHDEFASLKEEEIPDVILVRKHYPKYRRKTGGKRAWELKSLALEEHAGFGVGVKDPNARDMEMFMRDLEEDEEMRSKVNLFRLAGGGGGATKRVEDDDDDNEDEVEHDAPRVPLEQLLSEMTIEGEDDDDDL